MSLETTPVDPATPSETEADGSGTPTPGAEGALTARIEALMAEINGLKAAKSKTVDEAIDKRKKLRTLKEQYDELATQNESVTRERDEAQSKLAETEARLKEYEDRERTELASLIETLPEEDRGLVEGMPIEKVRQIAARLTASKEAAGPTPIQPTPGGGKPQPKPGDPPPQEPTTFLGALQARYANGDGDPSRRVGLEE